MTSDDAPESFSTQDTRSAAVEELEERIKVPTLGSHNRLRIVSVLWLIEARHDIMHDADSVA